MNKKSQNKQNSPSEQYFKFNQSLDGKNACLIVGTKKDTVIDIKETYYGENAVLKYYELQNGKDIQN